MSVDAMLHQSARLSSHSQVLRDDIRMITQKGEGGATVRYEESEQTERQVEIGFNLGGTVRSVLYRAKKSQAKKSEYGQAHIAFYPGCTGLAEYCGHQPVCFLALLISVELFEYFFDMPIEEVKQEIHTHNILSYTLFSPITADMKLALHQMLVCPYLGKTRNLFLEAKVLELVSHLRQSTSRTQRTMKKSLTAEDYGKMWKAKLILDESFQSPPSICELARRVGVNEFKLKNGFRQVHGTTPYRYLADQRLEKARSLLYERQMNVSEAAFSVGYSSLSHFAKIFRTKYGVSPHEYMAGTIATYDHSVGVSGL